jgi:hypothetical protein
MRVSIDISYFAYCWIAPRQSRLANVLNVLGYALATICRDSDCFTRPGVPCRIPVCHTEADTFASARRPALGPFAVDRLRPVLSPPEDRPPRGLTGDGAGSDGLVGSLDRRSPDR